jgi:hypothetical protein
LIFLKFQGHLILYVPKLKDNLHGSNVINFLVHQTEGLLNNWVSNGYELYDCPFQALLVISLASGGRIRQLDPLIGGELYGYDFKDCLADNNQQAIMLEVVINRSYIKSHVGMYYVPMLFGFSS